MSEFDDLLNEALRREETIVKEMHDRHMENTLKTTSKLGDRFIVEFETTWSENMLRLENDKRDLLALFRKAQHEVGMAIANEPAITKKSGSSRISAIINEQNKFNKANAKSTETIFSNMVKAHMDAFDLKEKITTTLKELDKFNEKGELNTHKSALSIHGTKLPPITEAMYTITKAAKSLKRMLDVANVESIKNDNIVIDSEDEGDDEKFMRKSKKRTRRNTPSEGGMSRAVGGPSAGGKKTRRKY